jgi:hypothetical protein
MAVMTGLVTWPMWEQRCPDAAAISSFVFNQKNRIMYGLTIRGLADFYNPYVSYLCC